MHVHEVPLHKVHAHEMHAYEMMNQEIFDLSLSIPRCMHAGQGGVGPSVRIGHRTSRFRVRNGRLEVKAIFPQI
jgi:hypothetical protein